MAARRTGTNPLTTHRCPSCRAPVLRQVVEVLAVTADATPRPPGHNPFDDPNHLTWCNPPTKYGPPRLRWIYRSTHPPNCPHPHHKDHQCTGRHPPADTTEQTDRLF